MTLLAYKLFGNFLHDLRLVSSFVSSQQTLVLGAAGNFEIDFSQASFVSEAKVFFSFSNWCIFLYIGYDGCCFLFVDEVLPLGKVILTWSNGSSSLLR